MTGAYVQLEPVETFTLPNKRGFAAARIELGRFGEGWSNAVHFQQAVGDMWGHGEPMGYWDVRKPERLFSTRDEALSDAIARLREIMGRRPVELAPQLAWLDTLVPDQADLFTPSQQKATSHAE